MQAALVPSLADHSYPPLYPPQTALLFAPFAMASYATASALWLITSIVLYVAVVSSALRAACRALHDRPVLWAAAAAFPPFWYVALFRQNSVIVLTVFFVGSLLLERSRSLLAGFALGLLAFKPQFGLPLAVLALYRRDWWLITGALLSIFVQALLTLVVFGFEAITEYVQFLPNVAASANAVEPVLYKSLSLRTLSRLLPSPVGEVAWALTCLAILITLVRVCRDDVPVRVSLAMVILAALLVNPHAYVYDGVVLALPFIWLGEWRALRLEGRHFLYQVVGFCAAAWAMLPVTLLLGETAGVVVTGLAIAAIALIFVTTAIDLIADKSGLIVVSSSTDVQAVVS